MVGVPLAMWLAYTPRAPVAAPRVRVETALVAFDAGDPDRAQAIAEKALRDSSLTPEERGIPHFVLGLVRSRAADASWLRNPKRTRALAVAHLRMAEAAGLPEGREIEGLTALGRNLLLTGQAVAAREPLERALESNPPRPGELLLLLSQACQLGSPPQLDKSETYVDRLLALPKLERELRDEALVQKSGLALLAGRLNDCRGLAEQIANDSPLVAERQLLRGRILLAEARATLDPSSAPRPAEMEKLRAAIDALRLAQDGDTPRHVTSAKAMYLIGTALVDLGQTRAALKQFERTRFLHADTPEGLAAELATAELLARVGDNERATMEAWGRVVKLASPPESLANPWFTQESLSLKLLETHRRWLDAENYPAAIEIARASYPVLPQARAKELEAETLRRWGSQTIERAAQATSAQREDDLRAGRAILRRAGDAFEKLAEHDFEERRYPLHLWTAAECYFEGQHYSRSIELLRKYLKHEARRGQAAALCRLGQSQLALGQYQAAVRSFEECIANYPKENDVYTARIWEAKARQELQQPAEAERLLRDNLSSDTLTPASREWRTTLLELSRLLAEQGRNAEAVAALEEWTERYPGAPEIARANYLLAQLERRQAASLLAQAETERVESARLARRREARQRFEQALTRYGAVVEQLQAAQATGELDALSARVFRNALFARGATLADLGRVPEAIEAYAAASNYSQRRPEALEAYVRVAAGYRRLGQALESRAALEQARVALSRMPEDTVFTTVTNYDRSGWSSLLDWLKTL